MAEPKKAKRKAKGAVRDLKAKRNPKGGGVSLRGRTPGRININ